MSLGMPAGKLSRAVFMQLTADFQQRQLTQINVAEYPQNWIACMRVAPPIRPYYFLAVSSQNIGGANSPTFEVLGNFASGDFWVYEAQQGDHVSGGDLPLSTEPGARLWVRLTRRDKRIFDTTLYRQ